MPRRERGSQDGLLDDDDPEISASSPTEISDSLIPELIGSSHTIRDLREKIIRDCVPSDDPVLITGESGTGKELIASAIHRLSARSSGPFLAINCSAIPDDLAESLLFGAIKGSFTGATSDKRGYFLEANHGTLFMDEVAEMSLTTQAKLLRVLQDKKVMRLGATAYQPIDVRIVAATNKDLNVMMETRRFREDLYFRISEIEIHTPTLRERSEDIPELARYFIEQANSRLTIGRSIEDGAFDPLCLCDWPGNVRQLRIVIRRLLRQLGPGQPITAAAVRALLTNLKMPVRPVRPSRGDTIQLPDELKLVGPYQSLRCDEKSVKLLVMEYTSKLYGDRGAAARRLGVSRDTLNRCISRLRSRSKEIEEGRYKGCLVMADDDREPAQGIHSHIIASSENQSLVLPDDATLIREYEDLEEFLARRRILVIRAAFQMCGTRMAAANRLRTSPKIVSQALWTL